MAPILNLANTVLLETERRENLASAAQGFLARVEAAGRAIARATSELIEDGMNVMTHSSSGTVLKGLLETVARGRRISVIVSESRPVREGLALADKIGRAGIPVTLIVDASAFRLLPEADLVIVGADALTWRGAVNKIGTAALALCARHLRKRVYVLAGTEKFVPHGYEMPDEEPKNSAEVFGLPLPNTTVSNLYFEMTPLNWIAGVVTEDGILRPAELSNRLRRLKLHPALS